MRNPFFLKTEMFPLTYSKHALNKVIIKNKYYIIFLKEEMHSSKLINPGIKCEKEQNCLKNIWKSHLF